MKVESLTVAKGRMIVKVESSMTHGKFELPNERNSQWAEIIKIGPFYEKYIVDGVKENHFALVPFGAGIILDHNTVEYPDNANFQYRIIFINEADAFSEHRPSDSEA